MKCKAERILQITHCSGGCRVIGTGAAAPDYFLSCPPLPKKLWSSSCSQVILFRCLISQYFICFPNISIQITVDWVDLNSIVVEFKTKKSHLKRRKDEQNPNIWEQTTLSLEAWENTYVKT